MSPAGSLARAGSTSSSPVASERADSVGDLPRALGFGVPKRNHARTDSACSTDGLISRDVDVDVDVERGARERAETSDGGLARASTSPLAPTGRARGKVSRALASVGDYFTERANRRLKLAVAIASVLALVVLIGVPLSAWAGG